MSGEWNKIEGMFYAMARTFSEGLGFSIALGVIDNFHQSHEADEVQIGLLLAKFLYGVALSCSTDPLGFLAKPSVSQLD